MREAAGIALSSTFIAAMLWMGLTDYMTWPKGRWRDRAAKFALTTWIVLAFAAAVYVDTHFPR